MMGRFYISGVIIDKDDGRQIGELADDLRRYIIFSKAFVLLSDLFVKYKFKVDHRLVVD